MAVVEYLCDDFIIDLRQLDTSTVGLAEGLRLILDQLVAVVTSPRHVAFYRLVVNGTAHVPEVGQTWYEHGPQVWHSLILRLLEGQRGQGQWPRMHRCRNCRTCCSMRCSRTSPHAP
ncbi:TetR/AcrR family transcriptional regulator C-terminal domain-containing protein [Pseudomonas qingdaonensis]|nr:TetR/AcrR family transcriptional regulator C-terminal domain-containing protein [Pseudomonas qingdaonensis]